MPEDPRQWRKKQNVRARQWSIKATLIDYCVWWCFETIHNFQLHLFTMHARENLLNGTVEGTGRAPSSPSDTNREIRATSTLCLCNCHLTCLASYFVQNIILYLYLKRQWYLFPSPIYLERWWRGITSGISKVHEMPRFRFQVMVNKNVP